jgi:hypothetical protein
MGQLIDTKGCGCLLIIGAILLSIIGFVSAAQVLMPVYLPRITGNIPQSQSSLFENDATLYPVYVEAPKEIRAGGEFIVTIRGAEVRTYQSPSEVKVELSTDDLKFVRQIHGATEPIEITGSAWKLDVQEFHVQTVNLESPPSQFSIRVTETLTTPAGTESESGTVTIMVDTTPLPTREILQAVVSLLGFLISVFGAVVITRT